MVENGVAGGRGREEDAGSGGVSPAGCEWGNMYNISCEVLGSEYSMEKNPFFSLYYHAFPLAKEYVGR